MSQQEFGAGLLATSAGAPASQRSSAARRERATVWRQVEVLVRSQLAMKARSWRWTLLEWLFPMQGIIFLWLIINLGNNGFLPFEKIETKAQSCPPENLLNASAPGLVGLMYIGGSVGFAPTAGTAADIAAARAVYSVFCGSTRTSCGGNVRLVNRMFE